MRDLNQAVRLYPNFAMAYDNFGITYRELSNNTQEKIFCKSKTAWLEGMKFFKEMIFRSKILTVGRQVRRRFCRNFVSGHCSKRENYFRFIKKFLL